MSAAFPIIRGDDDRERVCEWIDARITIEQRTISSSVHDREKLRSKAKIDLLLEERLEFCGDHPST
jgi:hypothetical protein